MNTTEAVVRLSLTKYATVTFSGALSYMASAPVSREEGMVLSVLFRMDSKTVSPCRTANEVLLGCVRNTRYSFLSFI